MKKEAHWNKDLTDITNASYKHWCLDEKNIES